MAYSSTQLTRITNARNTIRSRLAALGLVSTTANLTDCAAAIGAVGLGIGSCTVKFNGTCKLYNIAYCAVENGEIVAKKVYVAGVTSYTINNVAAQSLLVVGINAHGSISVGSGVTDLGVLFSTSNAFKIDTTNGSTVTITIASA